MRMYNPPHPGELIKEFMGDSTVTDLAKKLGVTRTALSRIINGKASITAEMALRLSKVFDTSAKVWLGMQADYDLWQLEQKQQYEFSPLFA
ncbi:HigA family addiction module antitoxin [Lonepinella sp. MS14437]|uniref:HigA family addiction module antitoxin n=1 Tax=unclassified Lonepinella TaxID=2642006 RepID=UPI0036DB4784